jgi:hypothetical protein
MRHGRLFITMLAALAVMAIGPAYAAAATSSFVDDSASDFAAGALGHGTAVANPGSVQLTTVEPFDGSTLPAGFTADPASGSTVSNGRLVVDGGRVRADADVPQGHAIEFRATFGTAASQHAGLAGAGSVDTGPWAIFSTSGGNGLWARTFVANGVDPEQDTPISAITGLDPTQPHTYRIEWSATTVSYFVDGDPTPVATHTAAIAGPMHAVVSDSTPGGDVVGIDWLDLGFFPLTGTFTSRVLDAGDAAASWGTLTPSVSTPGTTTVTLATRSAQTLADLSAAGWTPVPTGGAINATARYLQYSATLTTSSAGPTPGLDRVEISYTVPDPPASGGGTGGGGTSGTQQQSSGGATGTTQQSGTGSSATATDKTKPKVSVVAKSLKASKKGAVSFTVGCPATEQSCKITVRLKNGKKTAASKTVNVKGGKSKTVTLTLDTATRKLLAKRHTLKVSTVVIAVDAAGNKRTTTKQATLRRAAA